LDRHEVTILNKIFLVTLGAVGLVLILYIVMTFSDENSEFEDVSIGNTVEIKEDTDVNLSTGSSANVHYEISVKDLVEPQEGN